MNNKFTYQEVIDAFGMRDETISRWIQEGRFKGVQYIEGTWIFNEDATWISMPNKQIAIKEIVKAHNKLSDEAREMNNNVWSDLVWNIIYHFENKYNGSYENTIKNKINKNWQEEDDEKRWTYYLDKIKLLEI